MQVFILHDFYDNLLLMGYFEVLKNIRKICKIVYSI